MSIATGVGAVAEEMRLQLILIKVIFLMMPLLLLSVMTIIKKNVLMLKIER